MAQQQERDADVLVEKRGVNLPPDHVGHFVVQTLFEEKGVPHTAKGCNTNTYISQVSN